MALKLIEINFIEVQFYEIFFILWHNMHFFVSLNVMALERCIVLPWGVLCISVFVL